jgi:signal transduction histidine kinase
MNSEQSKNNQTIRHISHEIRNNLSICEIYSEIIKKQLIKNNINNDSITNAVNCIQNSVKLIGNSLLDLKTFDSISLKIYPSDKLLIDTVEMSEVYAKDKNITFTTNFEQNINILTDDSKLKGSIINIIKNAIEAIDTKGEIIINSFKVDNNLIITVKNNGPKISDEIQDKLFDDGFTTKNSGNGVGLYLCKRNLEAQNSSISLVKSDDNETIFEIKVPIA